MQALEHGSNDFEIFFIYNKGAENTHMMKTRSTNEDSKRKQRKICTFSSSFFFLTRLYLNGQRVQTGHTKIDTGSIEYSCEGI